MYIKKYLYIIPLTFLLPMVTTTTAMQTSTEILRTRATHPVAAAVIGGAVVTLASTLLFRWLVLPKITHLTTQLACQALTPAQLTAIKALTPEQLKTLQSLTTILSNEHNVSRLNDLVDSESKLSHARTQAYLQSVEGQRTILNTIGGTITDSGQVTLPFASAEVRAQSKAFGKSLAKDVATLKTDMDTLRTDVTALKMEPGHKTGRDITDLLSERLTEFEGRIRDAETAISRVRGAIKMLDTKVFGPMSSEDIWMQGTLVDRPEPATQTSPVKPASPATSLSTSSSSGTTLVNKLLATDVAALRTDVADLRSEVLLLERALDHKTGRDQTDLLSTRIVEFEGRIRDTETAASCLRDAIRGLDAAGFSAASKGQAIHDAIVGRPQLTTAEAPVKPASSSSSTSTAGTLVDRPEPATTTSPVKPASPTASLPASLSSSSGTPHDPLVDRPEQATTITTVQSATPAG